MAGLTCCRNLLYKIVQGLIKLIIDIRYQHERARMIFRIMLFVLVFFPVTAFAHPEPKCFPIEQARESLVQLGMERIWRGVPGPIGVIELWVNKYGGFSIGLATNDGAAYCPMAEGSKSIRSKKDWPGVGT